MDPTAELRAVALPAVRCEASLPFGLSRARYHRGMSRQHLARRNRLIRKLGKQADAILVTNETNVTWLTGFTGDSSYLLVGSDTEFFLTDSRYTTQVADECGELNLVSRDARQPMVDNIEKVVKKSRLKKLAIEGDSMSVSTFKQLEEKLEGVDLVAISGIGQQLRAVKDSGEIAEIRNAIAQAERGFSCLRAELLHDQTELQVSHNLEHAMRRFGAERAAFHPIVAVGPNSALPHAQPGRRLISESGVLLVDWGAETSTGYRSDLTRVVITGKVPARLRTIYDTVLKANMAAIKAIRPGAKCQKVDSIARTIIDKAGYGKYFGHGLGHGIGLDIHEQPRLSPISEDVLRPGMVVTVEPGIYIPGFAGVRIEDDVLVTRDGCEVLTSVPKRFDDAILNAVS